MYSLIRPWLTGIWAWKQVLFGNEPEWVLWDFLRNGYIAFMVCEDDDEICKLLIQSIFNEN